MQPYRPSGRNRTCGPAVPVQRFNQLSYYNFLSYNSSVVISKFAQYKVTHSMRAGVFIAAVAYTAGYCACSTSLYS